MCCTAKQNLLCESIDNFERIVKAVSIHAFQGYMFNLNLSSFEREQQNSNLTSFLFGRLCTSQKVAS